MTMSPHFPNNHSATRQPHSTAYYLALLDENKKVLREFSRLRGEKLGALVTKAEQYERVVYYQFQQAKVALIKLSDIEIDLAPGKYYLSVVRMWGDEPQVSIPLYK